MKPTDHVAEVRGQKSAQNPEHICTYIVPLTDLPVGTKLFKQVDQAAIDSYWKPEVSKLKTHIDSLNAQLSQPDVLTTNGGEAVAYFFRHDLDTGNGWIEGYRDLSEERPNPASTCMDNVREITPLVYKGDYDKLKAELEKLQRWEEMMRDTSALANKLALTEAKLAAATEALTKIAAIEDEQHGGDWDEIEEARSIANEALYGVIRAQNPD